MPALRVFGFPVRVKFGFLTFLALVIVWNPGIGWKFAIAVTVFSLIHEFGHAFAARHLGADAEIALDLLAGSTQYTPTRPITPLGRSMIALAGPAVEIVSGLAVLGILRVNPLDVGNVFDSSLSAVVWIAGPVFGLLNLLPVLPLDGGHVLSGVLESVWPRRGNAIAAATGFAITLAIVVVAFGDHHLRWLMPFAVLLLVLQLWPITPLPGRWGRARQAAVEEPLKEFPEIVADEVANVRS